MPSINRAIINEHAAFTRDQIHILQSLLVAKHQRGDSFRADSAILRPLIEYAKTPGAKSAIAAQMRSWGYNVTRDMVRAWLHPDEMKRRREPSFNYGLVLVAAVARLWPSHAKKNSHPKQKPIKQKSYAKN